MERYAVLRERIARGQTIVLDGPTGSELVRRGVRWRQNGLRSDADAVQSVHLEYLLAGADVVRTNTFQLNRRIVENLFRDRDHMRHIGAPDLDSRVPRLIPKAVEVADAARAQAQRPEVPIAGVMSPLEHCFRPDLAPRADQARTEHGEIARLLADAGVDLILLESMNTIAEARVAAEAARATGLPVWCSFVVFGPRVLSGEPLTEAAAAMQHAGVDVVLINCAPPDDIDAALVPDLGGAYAHVGVFDPPSWKFEFHPRFSGTEAWSPERYAGAASGWVERGARIVGGCCGTGPQHTRALKQRFSVAA